MTARGRSAAATALLAPLVLAAAVAAVLAPTLRNDDFGWMATTFHLGRSHPLTWASFGLDYAIGGMQPSSFCTPSTRSIRCGSNPRLVSRRRPRAASG